MSVPYFIFNNQNSMIDYECIIENELHEMSPEERVEVIKVAGRNGSLHRSYGDYDSYEYEIKNITIPCSRLDDVRNWLRGTGKLILHTDIDKYRDVRVILGSPMEFTNEWGVFYVFNVIFECQPFRRKVLENAIDIKKGLNVIFNHGTEDTKPVFHIASLGGEIEINVNDKIFTFIDSKVGQIQLDCELGQATLDGAIVRTKGGYPKIRPGENKITVIGKVGKMSIEKRSVWY